MTPPRKPGPRNWIAAVRRLQAQIDLFGNFDPNEDPVILGAGAHGDSSTPSNPDPADAGSVILGQNAYAGFFGVGVGYNSYAEGDAGADTSSVSVGPNSSAKERGVAVGVAAVAGGQPSTGSVAIGDGCTIPNPESSVGVGFNINADHRADGVTVVGANVTVANGENDVTLLGQATSAGGNASCAAVGTNAACTRSDQVMLGAPGWFAETDQGLVVTDTVTGTRYIIQVTSGLIVVSPAP